MSETFGWDIGGAHVKASRTRAGRVVDVAQWACPLWLGLDRLDAVLQLALARWPEAAAAQHAVTMTGEMTDLFEHREEGVRRIAECIAATLPQPRFFAGDAGWCTRDDVAREWPRIASANWLATAMHAAQELHATQGVLVDIGSTTTDLIAFGGGRVLTTARSDAERLATGELVYHGVVRTPLCAVASRIAWRGKALNVMNEFFATTADVYRLTGELNPAHDLQPSADNAPKDRAATERRLARMIGLDARDASADEWLTFAQAWRAAQVAELIGQLERVRTLHRFRDDATVVGAGCGDFLVPALVRGGSRSSSYGRDTARIHADASADIAAWAQVCAPSVAVAALLDRESR